MSQNCAASCCQQDNPVATSPTTSPAVLVDLDERCSGWRSYCGTNKYVSTNCPLTCSLVSSKCSSKPADTRSECSDWAAAAYCTSEYSAYMLTECATSCCVQGQAPQVNYCDSVTADTTQYDCQAYADAGHCVLSGEDWFSWMKGNCGTTCCNHHRCSNQGNKDTKCQGWADAGYCNANGYQTWMAKNCGQACFC